MNIANQHECTIMHLAETVKSLVDSDSTIVCVEAPVKRTEYEVPRRYGSSKKLLNLTGYVPETGLEEGLQHILSEV